MQVASLVLGIVGLLFAWIPFFGLAPPVAGLVFGAVGIKEAKAKNQPAGLGVAGLILSIVATLAGLIATILFLVIINSGTYDTAQPDETVTWDGRLQFTTRAFVCPPPADAASETCILEYDITAIDGGVADHLRQNLGADSGAVTYQPVGGWCQQVSLAAGETTSCQSVFQIPAGSEPPTYASYSGYDSAGWIKLSSPRKVWLPEPGVDAELLPPPAQPESEATSPPTGES